MVLSLACRAFMDDYTKRDKVLHIFKLYKIPHVLYMALEDSIKIKVKLKLIRIQYAVGCLKGLKTQYSNRFKMLLIHFNACVKSKQWTLILLYNYSLGAIYIRPSIIKLVKTIQLWIFFSSCASVISQHWFHAICFMNWVRTQ